MTIAVLTNYHQQRQQRAAAVDVTLPADGYVFSLRIDGRTPGSPQALTCQYHRMVLRLGIHKPRHYSATELIRAGVDIRTVAGQPGSRCGGESPRRAKRLVSPHRNGHPVGGPLQT
ncbi:site-specific integrase [Actinophytocola algeriensis]|uniref:Integrase n=1 Tax=Actinophytocola algeriensis TaxID=1768010 RepID=A0A7W7Q3I9_9PSEU|nr:hypothetical protein [Actinophytocola algeriensis]MBB4906262.1 integrase [Actinophytocola algeriensis]MBE1472053.1 integrase [Actinophytocola algeriensis]